MTPNVARWALARDTVNGQTGSGRASSAFVCSDHGRHPPPTAWRTARRRSPRPWTGGARRGAGPEPGVLVLTARRVSRRRRFGSFDPRAPGDAGQTIHVFAMRPSAAQRRGQVEKEGTDHEDRRHRRHRAHRLEGRRQAHRARPRGRSRPHLGSASTRSPAKGSPRRSTARRSSSTSRTRPTSSTRRRSSSSRPRPATCWPPKRPRASATTSPCRSSGRRSCPRAATSTKTTAGYFLAKLVEEALIQTSGIPYSIVHATQFFEFIKSIADVATDGDTVRLPPVALPADGGRGRRRGRRPGRGRRRRSTASSRSAGRRQFAFDERGPAGPRGHERPTRGRRRPGCDLLRDRRRRALARARRRGDVGEIRLDDWLRQATAVPATAGGQ